MFNNELENVLKEYKKVESEATCNVIVFFSFDTKNLSFESITDIKNDLFSKLNIEDTEKSIIAIEHENSKAEVRYIAKYDLKRFFKKIELKLENFDIEISKISPDYYFGIITEGIIGIKNKKLERTSQKDLFIAEFYPKDEHNFVFAKRINDDLVLKVYL